MRVLVLIAATLVAGIAHAEELPEALFGPAMQARQVALEANASEQAPRTWAAAEKHFEAARRDFERGRNTSRIDDRLIDALESYRAATTIAGRASETLATLIRARNAARDADAYLHDEAVWRRGEDRYGDAMVALERDNESLALKRAAQAEEHYRAAELTAIKTALLFEVRAELAVARRERVERQAPRTLARAQALLTEAETALTEDRYDTDRPRGLATDALREVRHAVHLAGLIRGYRDKDWTDEDKILDFEAQLTNVADAAGVAPAFEAGYAAVATSIAEVIEADRSRIRSLEEDVADRNAELLALESQLDELDQRLGGLAEERRTLAMQLEAQAQARRRFDEIGALFTREDGEVLRDGDNVILRLSGLTFGVGKTALTDEHTTLLSKVRRALSLLPPREVVVEGHTDSYGSDAINFRLSEDRANALRQYILDTITIAPNRVLAVGYGETRPVANNETRAGRARNRRIDIVIKPDLPGA